MVLDRQEGLFLSQGVQSVCDLEFRRDLLRFGVYLVVGSARCMPVVLGNVIMYKLRILVLTHFEEVPRFVCRCKECARARYPFGVGAQLFVVAKQKKKNRNRIDMPAPKKVFAVNLRQPCHAEKTTFRTNPRPALPHTATKPWPVFSHTQRQL